MDAWLIWAPRMRAARAEVEDNTASLAVAIPRTGCDMVQARMSEIERDMQPLAQEIIAAPATSLGGLRAKALVALWQALEGFIVLHPIEYLQFKSLLGFATKFAYARKLRDGPPYFFLFSEWSLGYSLVSQSQYPKAEHLAFNWQPAGHSMKVIARRV
jgi:hypothetical protein